MIRFWRSAEPRSSPALLSPVLFGFALHCRCIGVLHLEPVGRAATTVGRVLPLAHDAFEAELAGMGEDSRAVALDVLIEPDAGASLGPTLTVARPCGLQAARAADRRRSVR